MVQNLIVSGRKYLSSAELARRFGYTPDYLSRLAREGKVAATNINRKWFLDEESLQDFITQMNLGKEIRSTELKQQRKVERLIHSQEVKGIKTKNRTQTHIALAQSCAVLMCGAFVGLLGWSVSSTGITTIQLSVGFENASTQIANAIRPNRNPFISFSDWSVVASVLESFTPNELSEEVTVDQVITEHKKLEQLESVHFSDEVDVRFVDDGAGIVRPLFRNKNDGREYQILVVPVTEGN